MQYTPKILFKEPRYDPVSQHTDTADWKGLDSKCAMKLDRCQKKCSHFVQDTNLFDIL